MAAKDGKQAGQGKSLILILVVLVIGLAGGGIGARAFFSPKSSQEQEPEVGHTLDLGEFLMNLEGEHFLKANIALGLKEGIAAEKLKERIAPMRDVIIMTLSSKSRQELSSLEGKERAKKVIREKINRILESETHEKESVLEIYFTSFAMQ